MSPVRRHVKAVLCMGAGKAPYLIGILADAAPGPQEISG